ncbi:hypothetical protein [Nocardia fluminea]|uniref:hypothetical protein n=1 Tax=Nocardia fluminea TaxID=134984 RepID=UPI003D118E8A
MTETSVPFRVRIPIRVSDLDPQLHVTGSAYQQFADHARFACVTEAGVSVPDFLAAGVWAAHASDPALFWLPSRPA